MHLHSDDVTALRRHTGLGDEMFSLYTQIEDLTLLSYHVLGVDLGDYVVEDKPIRASSAQCSFVVIPDVRTKFGTNM